MALLHTCQSLPRSFTLVWIVIWRLAFLSISCDSVTCVCFCMHVIVARGAETFPERALSAGTAWCVCAWEGVACCSSSQSSLLWHSRLPFLSQLTNRRNSASKAVYLKTWLHPGRVLDCNSIYLLGQFTAQIPVKVSTLSRKLFGNNRSRNDGALNVFVLVCLFAYLHEVKITNAHLKTI